MDQHLSERAQQVARAMLRTRHENGDYVYLSPADLADKTGLSRGTVSQILGRLRNLGWLDDFREQGGGERLSRLTADGAVHAQEALAGFGQAPASAAPASLVQPSGRVRTLADIEATEPPAVVAAVRRALGRDTR